MANSDKALTWIHLSDIHFGHGMVQHRFDQKTVMEKLITDVERMRKTLGPPDFIIFTGDIAYSANSEKEYGPAARWINRLAVAARCTLDQIMVVPGNHDVDRSIAAKNEHKDIHDNLRAGRRSLEEVFQHASLQKKLQAKFTAFNKFASAYNKLDVPLGTHKAYWTRTVALSGYKFYFVGLNTALLSYNNEDAPVNLRLSMTQIHETIELAPADACLVVAMHHPNEWLLDGDLLMKHLQNRPNLVLSGHIHKQKASVHDDIINGSILRLVSGAGHSEADEEGHHCYSWGSLGLSGLEYYPRIWWKDDLDFVSRPASAGISQKTEDKEGYVFPVIKLPRRLAEWLQKTHEHAPLTQSVSSDVTLQERLRPSLTIASTVSDNTTVPSVIQTRTAPPSLHRYVPEWYIPRPDAEDKAKRALEYPGVAVVLRGPELCGKTWLLQHLTHQLSDKGQVIYLDLKDFGRSETMADLNRFLMELAVWLAEHAASMTTDEGYHAVETTWGRQGTPIRKLLSFMERQVWSRISPGRHLVLAIDGVEALDGRTYRDEFFGMLRAWLEKSQPKMWTNLRVLLTVSTVTSLSVNTIYQSPFNLTEIIDIPDFNLSQIADLAALYGLAWKESDSVHLAKLVGGHIYLVRMALYEMYRTGKSSQEILASSYMLYASYLRNMRRRLSKDADLQASFIHAIQYPHLAIPLEHYDRLQESGLLAIGSPQGAYTPRYGLYRTLFETEE